jgi:hypothetical protein
LSKWRPSTPFPAYSLDKYIQPSLTTHTPVLETETVYKIYSSAQKYLFQHQGQRPFFSCVFKWTLPF